jgi:hypothetical protein
MAKWFGSKDKDGNELTEEEAGKAVEAKFTSLEDSQKKTNETLGTLSDTIKAMNDRETAKQAKIDKDAKDAREAAARAANANESADDKFNRFAENPDGYIADRVSGATKIAMITAGRQVRAEVLGEKEYYTGEFKASVNALIEAEPNISLWSNPAFILNCYKIVLADNFEAIQKGELKKQAQFMGFSDGSRSGERNTDPNAKPTLEYRDQPGAPSSKAKYAASQMGLTEEDIIAAAKTGEIHGLEVVA